MRDRRHGGGRTPTVEITAILIDAGQRVPLRVRTGTLALFEDGSVEYRSRGSHGTGHGDVIVLRVPASAIIEVGSVPWSRRGSPIRLGRSTGGRGATGLAGALQRDRDTALSLSVVSGPESRTYTFATASTDARMFLTELFNAGRRSGGPEATDA